jgi:hypothetical protein
MSSPSPEEGAPVLLLLFFLGTVVTIAAVVVIARTLSDWADLGAVAFVLVVAGLIGAILARELRS